MAECFRGLVSFLLCSLDEERQCYDADGTLSYADDTLEQFFERVVTDGMAGQDQGDAALF